MVYMARGLCWYCILATALFSVINLAADGYELRSKTAFGGVMAIQLTASISSSDFVISDGLSSFRRHTLPGQFGIQNWWQINSQSSFL
jgi:hypothetical protein